MLKSKSALFISLLFVAQLVSAGTVMLEQSPAPIDQSLNGSVILEKQADNGGVILEKNIIVQKYLAGGLLIEKSPVLNRGGGVILERGGIKLLGGGVILERGGVIMEDNRLAGGLIIDRHVAGGLIIDRHGRSV